MTSSGRKDRAADSTTTATTMRAPPQERTVTWRMTVAYNGAAFHGWQRQKDNVRTIQQTLEDALSTIAKAPVTVQGAGRTDAGVHAIGQVASVRLRSRLTPRNFLLATSARLPDDMSVLKVDEVPAGFSAKKHSVGKHYRYAVLNRPARDPFRGAVTWHQRQALDIEAMRSAAATLVGEHDFESFRSVHCEAAHARRFIWDLRISTTIHGEVMIDVFGNAFCRNMVRIIAGTLVDIGRGNIAPEAMALILAAKDRTKAGITAPGHGLMLCEVFYPDTASSAGIPDDATFPGWPVDPRTWPPRDELPAADST